MSEQIPSWTNKFYITENKSSDTKGYFTQAIPTEPDHIVQPWGSVSYVYSSQVPADLNTSTHLEESKKQRTDGLPGGRVTVENGVAGAIVNFGPGMGVEPGKGSPWHRTRTMDYGVILEGELELELDGGEVRRLQKGDISKRFLV